MSIPQRIGSSIGNAVRYRGFRESRFGRVADAVLPVFPMVPLRRADRKDPNAIARYEGEIERNTKAHQTVGAIESVIAFAPLVALSIVAPELAIPAFLGYLTLTTAHFVRMSVNEIRKTFHSVRRMTIQEKQKYW